MLRLAASSLLKPSFCAPAACQAGMHTAAALQKAAPAIETHQLEGVLGLSGPEVQGLLSSLPSLAREKPSVLAERWQFMTTALGISQDRLRSLVREKPALLSDLNIRELRTMAGLSE